MNSHVSDWQGRKSLKWPLLCRVGCKTLLQSIFKKQLSQR